MSVSLQQPSSAVLCNCISSTVHGLQTGVPATALPQVMLESKLVLLRVTGINALGKVKDWDSQRQMLWLLLRCIVKGDEQRKGLHPSEAEWMLPSELYCQGVTCFAFSSCQSHQCKKASCQEIWTVKASTNVQWGLTGKWWGGLLSGDRLSVCIMRGQVVKVEYLMWVKGPII